MSVSNVQSLDQTVLNRLTQALSTNGITPNSQEFQNAISNVNNQASNFKNTYNSGLNIFPSHDFKKMALEKMISKYESNNTSSDSITNSNSVPSDYKTPIFSSETAKNDENVDPVPSYSSGVSYSTSGVPSSSYLGNTQYDTIISEMSAKYNVPYDLIRRVINAESGFNPNAVSSTGAGGLMQLMPATAKNLGVSNVFDPAQNIEGGVKYLSYLLQRFNGNVEYAVAGYNAGPGNVDKYKGIPPFKETQNYVHKILG